VKGSEEDLKIVVPRWDGSRCLTDNAMMLHVFVEVTRRFVRCGEFFFKRQAGEELPPHMIAAFMLSMEHRPNMLQLPCLILGGSYPVSEVMIRPLGRMPEWFRKYDLLAAKIIYGETDQAKIARCWQYSFLPGVAMPGWIPGCVLDEETQMWAKRSTYNRVFGWRLIDGRPHNHTMYSMDSFYPNKIRAIFGKLDETPNISVDVYPLISSILSEALSMLYDYTGTKKYFKTQRFCYDPMVLDDTRVPLDTSAGRFFPISQATKVDGVLYKIVGNGKKGNVLQRALDSFNHSYERVQQGKEPEFRVPLVNVAQKPEMFSRYDVEDDVQYEKKFDKCRDFYIVNIDGYLQSLVYQNYRQHIERGAHGRESSIMIGFKFWKAGAARFAKYMHSGDKRFFWITGDFESLDIKVKAFFLSLYTTEAMRYINSGKMSAADYAFLIQLGKHCGIHLTHKIINLFGDVWRIMSGVMPSGAYETSHGDSWIVLLYWCLMVAQVASTSRYGPRILQAVKQGEMPFKVYGDDFCAGVLRELRSEINGKVFMQSCALYGAKLRDVEEHDSFLSVVDPIIGEVIRPGVVILKRYFVLRDQVGGGSSLPEILPFRPMSTILFKLGYGLSRTYADMVPIAVALAYESFGINLALHQLAFFFFTRAMEEVRKSNWQQAYLSSLTTTRKKTNVTKFVRKYMDEGASLTVFPNVKKLQAMHIDVDGRGDYGTDAPLPFYFGC